MGGTHSSTFFGGHQTVNNRMLIKRGDLGGCRPNDQLLSVLWINSGYVRKFDIKNFQLSLTCRNWSSIIRHTHVHPFSFSAAGQA